MGKKFPALVEDVPERKTAEREEVGEMKTRFNPLIGAALFFAAMTVWLTPSVFAAESLRDGFRSPDHEYRPETWFHQCGRNVTKVGITKDLEAIKLAGLRGIHFFSKGNDDPNRLWPDIKHIKTLSPEWYDAVTHAAEECKRLGLSFTLHNCPGWSQSGGPWVPIEESQRRLDYVVRQASGGRPFTSTLSLQATPSWTTGTSACWHSPRQKTIRFKYLVPSKIESNNPEVSWEPIINCLRRFQLRSSPNVDLGKTSAARGTTSHPDQAVRRPSFQRPRCRTFSGID